MIRAYPRADGTFRLDSDRSSETYHIREKIKALGGHFEGRSWYVSEGALESLPVHRMYRVLLAEHCHTPEEAGYATEADIERGWTLGSCLRCDSFQQRVPIVRLLAPEEKP